MVYMKALRLCSAELRPSLTWCRRNPQAFALTDGGELLTLALATKGLMGLAARPQPATQGSTQRPTRGCRVRSRAPLGAPGSSPGFGPAALAPLRGYLLLAAGGGVAVYNATGGVQRHGPREVVAARLADLAAEVLQAKPSQTAGVRKRCKYLTARQWSAHCH